MADNYSQFSEMIEGVPAEGIAWAKKVLSINPDDCDDPAATDAALMDLLDLEGDVDLEGWPQFECKVEKNSIWLYSEEYVNFEHLEWFVRSLIGRFMPDYAFACTSAETCSKPRIGEFGGGWLVISKDLSFGSNTWDEARKWACIAQKKGSVWLSLGEAEVCLKRGEDGISVSLYRKGERDDYIGETFATYEDLENTDE